ncbi:hypothetical protein A3F62_02210 [Candidatus Woesebacteria bacterium RIFCSPHIGHO2_12_FULL_44_11]|uniref:Tryptophanyl-tRNA synthetase n=1 Tax=Candidatus Woesebacteria bacterium RIFCSPLOWO2_01_FULL_44_14 TaxID=1802525 RepID=A0A1F8C3L6_9BACT|nr:MAG: hypothetical protein A3F62_02210 [Candidatus Woesebacteria bacterium RIFCSPHIGHO2_12_FULL_44_11]OGM70874.1 MAG: hypothetical protein A2975_01200 [Candidatus Woesebacteria bacterium RIFCSPLOWO2_01_FULL_44_14]
MSVENWSIQVARQTSELEKVKTSQFGLVPLCDELDRQDEFGELREDFLKLGVWTLQNPGPIFRAIMGEKKFSILVGMRPTQRHHLGHLTTMKELSWLQSKGGTPIFVFASHESGKAINREELKENMSVFSRFYAHFTQSTLPAKSTFLSDKADDGLRLLEDRVSEQIKLNKLLQLYGWNNEISVSQIRIVSMMVATFLYPSILHPEQPTIVLSDINQITHAEMTKIIARKLELQMPTFSYRMLLPSLEGPEKRMSIKDPNSTVFLSDDSDQVSRKMSRAFSGGRKTIEEQRVLGGEPLRCSFFKIANTLIDYNEATDMYTNCVSGSATCRECKLKHLPEITKKFSESKK